MINTLSPFYEAINGGNPQYCNIYLTTLNGARAVLTETDIRQGGLQYDARTTSGDVIELGSAIAAQVTLTLEHDDWMDSFAWYGATLLLQIGVEVDGGVVYGNVGEFVVDEADKHYGVWTITALDNLVKLDKLLTEANWNTLNTNNYAIADLSATNCLVRTACAACGVRLGTLAHPNIVNAAEVAPRFTPDNNTTWRNIIQWCAAMTCSVAYCDENGDLCFGWYDSSTTDDDYNTISLDRRYKSDIAVNDVALTGLTVIVRTSDGEVAHDVGNDGYRLEIEGNPLFTKSNVATTSSAIWGKLNGFYYAPFTAQTVPYFYMQPLDACYVEPFDGGLALPSVITHITYTLNGATTIEAVGKSAQSKSYHSGSAFTRQQAVIIDNVKEQLSEYVSEQTNAVKELNNLMANAMGLQTTIIGGVWYAYYAPHNDGIKSATIVYTLNNQGFFWANGGYDEEHPEQTVWQQGITADGSAVLKQIFVEGISVSDETSPFSTTIKPDGWSLNNRENPLMSASVSTGEGILTLQKTIVGNYIKIGKARLYGTDNGMDIVIED